MKSINNQQAFTLIEILLYVTIIAIVTIILTRSIITFSQGQGKVEARTQVNSGIRFALEKIHQDIRSATSVSTPTAGGTSTSLVMDIGGSNVTYCVVSNQVRRAGSGSACNSGSPVVTPSELNVTNLSFSRLDNTNTILSKTTVSIQTSITASYNSSSPNYQYTETKQATSSLR